MIILFPLILKERPGEKLAPWTAGSVSPESKKMQLTSWKVLLKSLFKAFSLPVSLMMGVAVFIYRIGAAFVTTLLPLFTVQELGWTEASS